MTLARRFWAKVDRSNPDGCWLWTGATGSNGYGVLGKGGKAGIQTTAHRISWELHHGPIADSTIFVCHTCDNPPCVRPDHLFLAPQEANLADASAKGRLVGNHGIFKGSNNLNAKITEADVPIIRQRIAGGETDSAIARDYAVSGALIWQIRKGRSWRHVV